MTVEEFQYGMSCMDPDQNDTSWVSKTVGRLVVLDYCIKPENMKSELALFPVSRNQFVLVVVKMNQDMNFRRSLIVHSSPGCINTIENIASNHGRLNDLRSSFLDVSILNEVLSTNQNIPNIANFNLWKNQKNEPTHEKSTTKEPHFKIWNNDHMRFTIN